MLQITHIDGKKVIEQDVAIGTHPRWRDQEVPYKGIAFVLLEDGTSGFACETCGYLREKIASVASHRNAHGGPPEPHYPLETIKALLRSVKRAKQAGVRDFCEQAAADLNRRGIKTMDGEPWASSQVSRLFRHWESKIKATIPPAPTQRQPEATVTKSLPSRREPVLASSLALTDTDPLIKRMIKIGEKLQDLTAEWEGVVSDVAIALAEGKKVGTKELEELRADAARFRAIDQSVFDKAAKFDAAQSLFGGGK